MNKQLDILSNKETLTAREKQVADNLQEALTISEFISKGVKDMKELENKK